MNVSVRLVKESSTEFFALVVGDVSGSLVKYDVGRNMSAFPEVLFVVRSAGALLVRRMETSDASVLLDETDVGK